MQINKITTYNSQIKVKTILDTDKLKARKKGIIRKIEECNEAMDRGVDKGVAWIYGKIDKLI